MSNVEALSEKLKQMGVRDFHVCKGPEWEASTPEQRAGEILRVIEQIEAGDCEEVILGDSSQGEAHVVG